MNKQDILKFDWIEEKYDGILEIKTQKCTNHYVLESVILKLQKEYDLVKIFDGWIRAFKKEAI